MNIRHVLKPLKRSRFEEMINLSRILQSVFQFAIISVTLISINIMQNPVNLSTILVLVLLVLLLFFYFLFRSGYYRIAGSGLLVSISAIFSYNLIVAGGINDKVMIVFPILITIVGLGLGKKYIPFITGIILAEVSGIYWLTSAGLITPFDASIVVHFHNLSTVFILLVITGAGVWITVRTFERKFQELLESELELRKSFQQTIVGWGKALELIDEKTEGHSLRVTDMTLALAQMLDIEGEDLEHIRRGAYLHDIGKMGVSDEILNKKSSLTEQERTIIEGHPLHSYILLKDIAFLERALDIPVYHHENWDGSGYPYRVAGKDIPLSARIFAIAENWDALTSDRPYRKAWPEDKVVKYIENQSGKKFDPELVELFLTNI